MKLLEWLKRIFSKKKLAKKRPHFYSKNAWSYCVRGLPTPAQALYAKLQLGA